jgi:hypothetical protein
MHDTEKGKLIASDSLQQKSGLGLDEKRMET